MPAKKPPEKRATGGQKAKASKIRKALATGDEVPLADQIWFQTYEEAHPSAAAKDVGASSASKKIHRTETIEEQAKAVGTGAAAPNAASLAALALATREEGRRIDALTVNAVDALKAAVDVYKAVAEDMRKDRIEDRKAVRELTQSIRNHHLAQVKAEVKLLKKQHETDAPDDPVQEMIAALLPAMAERLGMKLAEADDAPPPPPNGAKKKTPPPAA